MSGDLVRLPRKGEGLIYSIKAKRMAVKWPERFGRLFWSNTVKYRSYSGPMSYTTFRRVDRAPVPLP